MATVMRSGAAAFWAVRYAPGMKLTRKKLIVTTVILVASLGSAFTFRKTGDTNPIFAYLETHGTARCVVREACALIGLADEFEYQIRIATVVRVIREVEDGTAPPWCGFSMPVP